MGKKRKDKKTTGRTKVKRSIKFKLLATIIPMVAAALF